MASYTITKLKQNIFSVKMSSMEFSAFYTFPENFSKALFDLNLRARKTRLFHSFVQIDKIQFHTQHVISQFTIFNEYFNAFYFCPGFAKYSVACDQKKKSK